MKFEKFTTLNERDKELLALGLCKGVYSPQLKKIEEVKFKWLRNPEAIVAIGRHSYLKGQDIGHLPFMDKIRNWLKPAIEGLDKMKNAYPTSASSVGFRHVIHKFANSNRKLISKGYGIRLMEGEYEGYTEYSKDANLPIRKFCRNNFKEELEDMQPGELIIISEPSGIDGNYYDQLDGLLTLVDEKQGIAWLDLAYHGTTSRIQSTDVNHSCVQGVFFSFSKSFGGCFYDRIGGVFSKEELPGMIGDRLWFKNLPIYKYGEMMLDRFPVENMELVYNQEQKTIIERLNSSLGFQKNPIQPSDVYLIGTRKAEKDSFEDLNRDDVQRFVISPTLDILVNDYDHETIIANYKKIITGKT